MAHVKLSIQLIVGKVEGTVQEQPSGPCVVAQEAFRHVHVESFAVAAAILRWPTARSRGTVVSEKNT